LNDFVVCCIVTSAACEAGEEIMLFIARMEGEAKALWEQQLEEWKTRRVKNLTSPTGWLSLCGLFWLKEGENTVGTSSTDSVVIPESATTYKVVQFNSFTFLTICRRSVPSSSRTIKPL
jgi:hypothetical protein